MESPTAWNVSDLSSHLNVNGLEVNYVGPGKKWVDSAMIKTNNPIPQCELYVFYFEVNIINGGENGIIGIGFCTKDSKNRSNRRKMIGINGTNENMEDEQVEKLIDSFLISRIKELNIIDFDDRMDLRVKWNKCKQYLKLSKLQIYFLTSTQHYLKEKKDQESFEKILKISLKNFFEIFCDDSNKIVESLDDFIYYERDFLERILNVKIKKNASTSSTYTYEYVTQLKSDMEYSCLRSADFIIQPRYNIK
ncbi:18890_t:CDS:2, partial [Racocetra persica]